MPTHNWGPRQPVYASLSTGTPSSLNIPPSPPSFPLRPDQYVDVRPPDPSAPLGTFEHPFPYGYVHSEQGKKAKRPRAVPPPSRASPPQAQDPEIRCTGCPCHQAHPPSTAAVAADETGTQQPTDSASSSTTSLTSPPSPRQPAPRRRVRFNVSKDHRPSDRSIPSSPHPSRLGFGSSSTDHARDRAVPTATTRTIPLPTSRRHLPPSNPRCIICDTTPAIPSASETGLAFCDACWDEAERAEVKWSTDG